jgi:hypothetical protein
MSEQLLIRALLFPPFTFARNVLAGILSILAGSMEEGKD